MKWDLKERCEILYLDGNVVHSYVDTYNYCLQLLHNKKIH
jgi:hypothetical protein